MGSPKTTSPSPKTRDRNLSFPLKRPRHTPSVRLPVTTIPMERRHITIFVLDLLNSSFEDFAFIRYSVQKYLAAQPPLLSSPAEMMVVDNESLELIQGPTRNKADLLYALDHLPPVIPYKWQANSFNEERFNQSLDALQQIALQNKGVPGRKNVIWVGHGSPSFSTRVFTQPVVHEILAIYARHNQPAGRCPGNPLRDLPRLEDWALCKPDRQAANAH